MKIVIGISGASGAIYAKQLLDVLAKTPHEISLVISENAHLIAKEELGFAYTQYDRPIFGSRDFSAPFASGSAKYDQLVVIPCSMGTFGRIAHGFSDDLLTRTADVFLKEKRKIVLVPRETPWSLIHIENARLLTLAGAVVLPAIPSFYSKPKTIEEAVDTVIARVLDHMGIENRLRERWGSV
ncbi:MAG: UbiX family flavin prenyltransferase [Deltaproteobacteria bacterium]|nr:UbiX family flavin prenyltransferase [Deltaproteobacteria bacterium]